MTEVTRILSAIEQGDSHAAERLLPLVYDELRKLAAQKLAQEKPGQTLQATALVHEAYLRLVGRAKEQSSHERRWDSRGHFFAAAAEAMRRILINQARDKLRVKRGGGRQRVDLGRIAVVDDASPDDLLALDEALEQLAQENKACAELIKLRDCSIQRNCTSSSESPSELRRRRSSRDCFLPPLRATASASRASPTSRR